MSNFIETIAPIIQKYAPQYGIKVVSPIIGQAVLESASGTSELAVKANNYFGLKYRANRCPSCDSIYYKVGSEQNADGSYTSSAMQWCHFPNMDAGVKGYFDFTNISNYANLKGVTDPKLYLENIKADKYATSINYVNKVMNVIKKYDLTKYDSVNGGVPYLVRVKVDSLNIRKGPGINYGIVGVINKGYKFTIVEEQNGFGKLKSGVGWISVKEAYVERV